MDQNQNNNFGTLPQASAEFGNVPNHSETFRMVQNDTEGFRSLPSGSERKENHTLTVREVARMFEVAGVARTERSIVNWCQPNRTGIARLDSYFDPNERRYYISPQSAEQAIAEEKAKATKHKDSSDPFGNVPQTTETVKQAKPKSEEDESRAKELELENRDLNITNRAKDMVIDQMQKERNGFFEQLLAASRKLGALETKLLQIESSPRQPIEAAHDENSSNN